MSNHYDEPLKAIDGRARAVRELLDKAVGRVRRARKDAEFSYKPRARRNPTSSFYQREYAWQERQVRELIDDLTGKFLDHYEPGHARHEVERYGHYFLGSVVISHKRSKRFVVDGQQRLTTLTLLLIYLHDLQTDREEISKIKELGFQLIQGAPSHDRID